MNEEIAVIERKLERCQQCPKVQTCPFKQLYESELLVLKGIDKGNAAV